MSKQTKPNQQKAHVIWRKTNTEALFEMSADPFTCSVFLYAGRAPLIQQTPPESPTIRVRKYAGNKTQLTETRFGHVVLAAAYGVRLSGLHIHLIQTNRVPACGLTRDE